MFVSRILEMAFLALPVLPVFKGVRILGFPESSLLIILCMKFSLFLIILVIVVKRINNCRKEWRLKNKDSLEGKRYCNTLSLQCPGKNLMHFLACICSSSPFFDVGILLTVESPGALGQELLLPCSFSTGDTCPGPASPWAFCGGNEVLLGLPKCLFPSFFASEGLC